MPVSMFQKTWIWWPLPCPKDLEGQRCGLKALQVCGVQTLLAWVTAFLVHPAQSPSRCLGHFGAVWVRPGLAGHEGHGSDSREDGEGLRATKSKTSLHPEQRGVQWQGERFLRFYRQQSRDRKLGTDSDPCWWWRLGLVLDRESETQGKAWRGGNRLPGALRKVWGRREAGPRQGDHSETHLPLHSPRPEPSRSWQEGDPGTFYPKPWQLCLDLHPTCHPGDSNMEREMQEQRRESQLLSQKYL